MKNKRYIEPLELDVYHIYRNRKNIMNTTLRRAIKVQYVTSTNNLSLTN